MRRAPPSVFLENVRVTLTGSLHVPSGVGVERLAEFILEANYSSRRIIRQTDNSSQHKCEDWLWRIICLDVLRRLHDGCFGVEFAPCKGIRIPESRNFLLVESGILGFEIRNPALGIRNPTKDWNPESNLLKIHSRLNWATRSKEKPSMESLPRVYASTWRHTV